MKIKKGTVARVRRTNQIVTIEDVELIRKGGMVHKYCHLIPESGGPSLWMDSSELGEVVEQAVYEISSITGKTALRIVMTIDYRTGKIEATGHGCEWDLNKDDRFPAVLASRLLDNLEEASPGSVTKTKKNQLK